MLGRVATLYIREFPDTLQRRLRVAAAQHDESMKSVVIRAVERELDKLDSESTR